MPTAVEAPRSKTVKARSKKEHGCIAKINKALETRGDCLVRMIVLKGAETPIVVATDKADGSLPTRSDRNKAVLLVASFCPFCGEKMDVK